VFLNLGVANLLFRVAIELFKSYKYVKNIYVGVAKKLKFKKGVATVIRLRSTGLHHKVWSLITCYKIVLYIINNIIIVIDTMVFNCSIVNVYSTIIQLLYECNTFSMCANISNLKISIVILFSFFFRNVVSSK